MAQRCYFTENSLKHANLVIISLDFKDRKNELSRERVCLEHHTLALPLVLSMESDCMST